MCDSRERRADYRAKCPSIPCATGRARILSCARLLRRLEQPSGQLTRGRCIVYVPDGDLAAAWLGRVPPAAPLREAAAPLGEAAAPLGEAASTAGGGGAAPLREAGEECARAPEGGLWIGKEVFVAAYIVIHSRTTDSLYGRILIVLEAIGAPRALRSGGVVEWIGGRHTKHGCPVDSDS